jgi:putative transposase
MLKVVQENNDSNYDERAAAGGSLLDEIVRDGARQMLTAALRAEVAAFIDAHAGEVDEAGHRLVVRNGYHAPREVVTSAGAVPVRQPRVNDKRVDEVTGERNRFASSILPASARKSPQLAEVLPLLYLHGISTLDFTPALEQFLGTGAGLSPSAITRLTTQWQGEATAFNERSLADSDFVYVWADGIHLKVRLTQDKVCLLVMIGERPDGRKELIALADGHRESTESWADLLRSCKRRGMRAPVLAAGDGALGFWAALRDVLLAFYDYPAEHWIHLRTTNPIESTFATVRLRQRVTKGPGSRAAGIAMAFKLIQSAQGRWRAVNAPHLVPLVRAGATFKKGKLVERDAQIDHEEDAA